MNLVHLLSVGHDMQIAYYMITPNKFEVHIGM